MNRHISHILCIAFGGFVFGYEAAVISGTLDFIIPQFELEPGRISLLFLLQGLAAMCASFAVGPLADRYGRKPVLLFLSGLYILSALMSSTATNFTLLLIGRTIGGCAYGSLVIAPMYIAEMSPAQHRGRLGSLNQLNIVVGLSASFFVNALLLHISKNHDTFLTGAYVTGEIWKWMFGLGLLPACIWAVCLTFLPRSPHWVALQKQRTIGSTGDDDLKLANAPSPQASVSPLGLKRKWQILLSTHLRPILIISIIIGIVQQASGVNAIFYYAPIILGMTGIGQDAAFWQAVLIGLTNVLGTLIVIWLIDKIGRRPLMITGLMGIILSLGITTYGFSQAHYEITAEDIGPLSSITPSNSDEPYAAAHMLSPLKDQVFTNDISFKSAIDEAVGRDKGFTRDHGTEILSHTMTVNATLILIGILGFVGAFSISLGPVMWVFLGEVFPLKIRGLAMSFVTLFNSGTATLISAFFPVYVARYGVTMSFLFFLVCAILGLIFVVSLMPETKGLTLEEIEHKYAKT